MIEETQQNDPDQTLQNMYDAGQQMPLTELVQLIADHDGLWLSNFQLKYLTITIDTRESETRYTVFDRDKNKVSVDRIVEASKGRFAETTPTLRARMLDGSIRNIEAEVYETEVQDRQGWGVVKRKLSRKEPKNSKRFAMLMPGQSRGFDCIEVKTDG